MVLFTQSCWIAFTLTLGIAFTSEVKADPIDQPDWETFNATVAKAVGHCAVAQKTKITKWVEGMDSGLSLTTSQTPGSKYSIHASARDGGSGFGGYSMSLKLRLDTENCSGFLVTGFYRNNVLYQTWFEIESIGSVDELAALREVHGKSLERYSTSTPLHRFHIARGLPTEEPASDGEFAEEPYQGSEWRVGKSTLHSPAPATDWIPGHFDGHIPSVVRITSQGKGWISWGADANPFAAKNRLRAMVFAFVPSTTRWRTEQMVVVDTDHNRYRFIGMGATTPDGYTHRGLFGTFSWKKSLSGMLVGRCKRKTLMCLAGFR